MDASSQSRGLRRWGDSSFVKLVMLAFLVLVLLLPVARVRSLIYEREGRRGEVAREVTRVWGEAQTLNGPILNVQVRQWIEGRPGHGAAEGMVLGPSVSGKAKAKSSTDAEEPGTELTRAWESSIVHLLPRQLTWRGRVVPQIRYRGIFEVIVYETHLEAAGVFEIPDLEAPDREVDWETADLVLGISDVRGLQERVELRWQDQEVDLLPGTGGAPFVQSGVFSRIPGEERLAPGTRIPFSFELVLRGSDQLLFVPSGAETHVELASPWASPSFVGAFLPDRRQVSDTGFSASWQVPLFGRSFPSQWSGNPELAGAFESSAFGVGLLLPVDAYQQSERAVKYAVLFIVLTFGTFFLLELLSPVRLHAVQYLLVGFAQTLFYVLLLALSEHLGFGRAYALAAAATVGLIASYSRSILASRRRALVVLGCLGLLFGYLYVLLQLEDYALLVGASGLFVALAVTMLATRHLDWFTLRFAPADASADGEGTPT